MPRRNQQKFPIYECPVNKFIALKVDSCRVLAICDFLKVIISSKIRMVIGTYYQRLRESFFLSFTATDPKKKIKKSNTVLTYFDDSFEKKNNNRGACRERTT